MSKLFIQLRPDPAALAYFNATRRSLGQAGNPVPDDELHLTVLHVGQAGRLIQAFRARTDLDDDAIRRQIGRLRDDLETLAGASSQVYNLEVTGLARFGATLAVALAATPALERLHDEALRVLRSFVSDCGIADPDIFMRSTKALAFASGLRPHVALYKRADPTLPTPALHRRPRLHFTMMPVVYDR